MNCPNCTTAKKIKIKPPCKTFAANCLLQCYKCKLVHLPCTMPTHEQNPLFMLHRFLFQDTSSPSCKVSAAERSTQKDEGDSQLLINKASLLIISKGSLTQVAEAGIAGRECSKSCWKFNCMSCLGGIVISPSILLMAGEAAMPPEHCSPHPGEWWGAVDTAAHVKGA